MAKERKTALKVHYDSDDLVLATSVTALHGSSYGVCIIKDQIEMFLNEKKKKTLGILGFP